jgi:hypothetical protein
VKCGAAIFNGLSFTVFVAMAVGVMLVHFVSVEVLVVPVLLLVPVVVAVVVQVDVVLVFEGSLFRLKEHQHSENMQGQFRERSGNMSDVPEKIE